MALVEFEENGYKYFNKSRTVLFTTDNTHAHLFDYVAKDVSRLPELLEQYISKKMDIVTFNLNDYKYDDNDSSEIKEALRSLHLYYEHEYKDTCINAIGNYFNAMLVYSIYTIKTLEYVDDRKWYLERFNALTISFLEPDDKASGYYCDKYMEWIGAPRNDASKHYEITFTIDIPQKRPLAFANEVRTHEAVKKMLYWLLDITAPNIGKLTLPQRMWIYTNIFYRAYGQFDLSVVKHLLFKPTRQFGEVHNDREEIEHIGKMHDLFEPLYKLNLFDVDCGDMPSEVSDSFNNVIEYAKSVSKSAICEEYEIDSLHQLLYLEILAMVQTNTMIRRCKHCRKHFVVTNRKTAYCDRADKAGRRCSEVGSKQSFQEKIKTEYPLKIYTRAYKTHHARRKHGTMSENEFLAWFDEAKEKLNEVRAGELNINIFEEWLKK